MRYDFVVVGAGMFGASFARMAADKGKKVLVIDAKPHTGGMCHTEVLDGIVHHKYGPHVFHTNNEEIWDFVNRFAEWRQFTVRTKAFYQGRMYPLPFAMPLFHMLWGVVRPADAVARLEKAKVKIENPRNLREWALANLGHEIYEKFIHDYTVKQWGTEPDELPASILRRLPVRMTYDDSYFTDRWQAVPIGGYAPMFSRMLSGIEVKLGVDYFSDRDGFDRMGKVIYTGRVDRFFDYSLGELDFRTCTFDTKSMAGDYQGNPVVHYVERDYKFTRVIEHKHFSNPSAANTIVTWEYPGPAGREMDPFYPVNNEKNDALYARYCALGHKAVFAGRAGSYRYFDMCEVIAQAKQLVGCLS